MEKAILFLFLSLLLSFNSFGQNIGISEIDSLLGKNINQLIPTSANCLDKNEELLKHFSSFKVACVVTLGNDTIAISLESNKTIIAIHKFLPNSENVLKEMIKRYKEPYSFSSFHVPGQLLSATYFWKEKDLHVLLSINDQSCLLTLSIPDTDKTWLRLYNEKSYDSN